MKAWFLLLAWGALWSVGGVWIVRRAFNLRKNEQLLVGLGVGMIAENWLANLLGQVLPSLAAFWLAAWLVLLVGLGLHWPSLRKNGWTSFRVTLRPVQLITLLALVYVFFMVGRGLAVLDDYQNLPVTSLLAAGDLPPRFALDPAVRFNYHYLILLFAGQVMRIAQTTPWVALDLVRAAGFSLGLMLTSLYVQRVTWSKLAGVTAGVVAAFGGGTRWLMLLLPGRVLARISPHLQMPGAYAGFTDLAQALVSPWPVETGARWAIPFAYANGVNVPGVWNYHSGHAAFTAAIAGVLLLVHNRQRSWPGWVVTTVLLAALTLVSEVGFATLAAGLVLVAVAYMVQHKSWRLPASLWRWFGIFGAAGVISLFQGGVITGVAASQLGKIVNPGEAAASYFTGGFSLLWPPAVLSSHLGYLPLTEPYALLTALLEIGPTLLILPLVAVWAFKTYRWGRWYEAALFMYAFLSVGLFFVRYEGSAGPTALIRAQNFSGLALAWAAPVLWVWGRKRSDTCKSLLAALLLVSVLGGMVVFGTQLLAAREPLVSTFLSELDERMLAQYWDELPEDALIFDPLPSRAPTVFARYTNSHLTWYTQKPEWRQLMLAPEPHALRKAGFDFVYLDHAYWMRLSVEDRERFEDSCMSLVAEEQAKNGEDFRRLLDIRGCQ